MRVRSNMCDAYVFAQLLNAWHILPLTLCERKFFCVGRVGRVEHVPTRTRRCVLLCVLSASYFLFSVRACEENAEIARKIRGSVRGVLAQPVPTGVRFAVPIHS